MVQRVKGMDSFYLKPGQEDLYATNCLVCGSILKVERIIGPGSFAEAMSGKASTYDYYYCEHSEEGWHSQALNLVKAINTTPSATLANLMQQELEVILTTHKPTKSEYEPLLKVEEPKSDEINYSKIAANLVAKLAKGDADDKYEVFISLVDVINAIGVKALSKFKLNGLDVMGRNYTGIVDRQGVFELSNMDIVRLISLSEKLNIK